ncbi:MAG: phosphoadenosine phosphosulfate reductase family protein [Bacteroidia bacterium]|nr:phosphoadenosine phosphosulfate reductase family protein [Bacteroidia bacterium]
METNISILDKLSPKERVEAVLEEAENPVLTTNFRPFEAAILHLVTDVRPDIPVIWCDTGYNTESTYRHAQVLIEFLQLNIRLYTPRHTAAYRSVFLGQPEMGTREFDEFTEQVKLEPFRRAMSEMAPDLWFTNLRKGQTALRDSLGIASYTKDRVLKISPFYDFTDDDLQLYLSDHGLPNESDYHDPTKVLSDRECGLHLT